MVGLLVEPGVVFVGGAGCLVFVCRLVGDWFVGWETWGCVRWWCKWVGRFCFVLSVRVLVGLGLLVCLVVSAAFFFFFFCVLDFLYTDC